MSGIKVTPEQLQAIGGQVGRGSSEIEGQLRGLGNTISPLVGGDWAGQASARFASLWSECQISCRRMTESLDAIAQILGHAGRSYAEAEQTIASTFG